MYIYVNVYIYVYKLSIYICTYVYVCLCVIVCSENNNQLKFLFFCGFFFCFCSPYFFKCSSNWLAFQSFKVLLRVLWPWDKILFSTSKIVLEISLKLIFEAKGFNHFISLFLNFQNYNIIKADSSEYLGFHRHLRLVMGEFGGFIIPLLFYY